MTAVRCVVNYARVVGVRRYAEVSCRYGGGQTARWHGGVVVVHQVAHGGTVVSRWLTRWHGGTVVSQWRTRWHGGTVVARGRTR